MAILAERYLIMLHHETYLQQRIELMKKKAQRIKDGIVETDDDFINVLRFRLSQAYNIPFFDTYFSQRTLDDLVFELELLRASVDKTAEVSESLKAFAESGEDLFADLSPENDQFMQSAHEFFQTGNFIQQKDDKTNEQ